MAAVTRKSGDRIMKVIDSGVVHDGHAAPRHQRSCARTTIMMRSDGALLATCRLGEHRDTVGGHHAIFLSSDQGKTWEMLSDSYQQGAFDGTPGEVIAFTPVEHEPDLLIASGLWLDRSRPELPMSNPVTQGFLPMRIFHTTSTDGGVTWDGWRQMDTEPHVAASCATQATYLLPGGELAQPYEKWKEYDDPTPGVPGSWFRLSKDGGVTWPEFVPVAQHPDNELFYWDLRLARHPETDQWVSMFWTHEPASGRDIDIHICWGEPDARSWTTPVGAGLIGQHCQPIALGGDTLLAVYPHRGEQLPGIYTSISDDFGKTWDRERDLVVYEYESSSEREPGGHGPRTQKEKFADMAAWRFGHPRGILLPDRTVFVVFYAGDDLIKSFHWARIEI